MNKRAVGDEGAEGTPIEPIRPLLTVKEVADLLRLSPHTIRRRAKQDPSFPQPFVVGGQQQRMDRSDVERYIAEQRRQGRAG